MKDPEFDAEVNLEIGPSVGTNVSVMVTRIHVRTARVAGSPVIPAGCRNPMVGTAGTYVRTCRAGGSEGEELETIPSENSGGEGSARAREYPEEPHGNMVANS